MRRYSIMLLGCSLFLAPAAAAPELQSQQSENAEPPMAAEDRQTEEAIGELRGVLAMLLLQGEPNPDWSVGSVNLVARIDALPGGTERHYLRSRAGDGGTEVSMLDTRIEALPLPESWQLLNQRVSPQGEGDRWMASVVPIDQRYVMTADGPLDRQGPAWCSMLNAIRLYEIPGARSDLTPDEAEGLFLLTWAIGRDMNMCVGYREIEPGRYVEAIYSSDGRPYLTINADPAVYEVVAADDLETLLEID